MNYVADVAKTFFKNTWDMFLHTDVPGLGVSFAALLISLFIIGIAIRIFAYLTGFSMGGADYGRVADAADKARNAEKWQHRNKIGFGDR